MTEPGEGAGELLLDLQNRIVVTLQTNVIRKGKLYLMTAVGAGHVDDEPELPGGVLHVLPLELLQLGLVSPGEPLVAVDGAVESERHSYDSPADSLEEQSAHQQCSHGALAGD